MNRKQHLGKAAEQLASRYLENKGHRVLAINYRFGHKEIDVISLAGDILVFTEVKARSSYAFGFPEEAVHPRKQSFLKLAAEGYCLEHPEYTRIRFDVISLWIRKGQVVELQHFEDAFY